MLRLIILTSELRSNLFLNDGVHLSPFGNHVFVSILQAAIQHFSTCSGISLLYPQSDCLYIFDWMGTVVALWTWWICMFVLWMMCNLYVFCEWCQNSAAVMAVGFHYGEIQMAQFWLITICWGDTVVSRPSSSDMVCWIFVNAMLPKFTSGKIGE